ncbi:MAG: hypothetical protein R2712_28415 [Vicinamibacterales bacterium]
MEMAVDAGSFDVEAGIADRIVRVRTDALMWQRERLLNIGVAALPEECDAVVWLDCDLLFERDDWVADTARRLDDTPVVQPFEVARYLPRGVDDPAAAGESPEVRGIAATLARHPDRQRALAHYLEHGHTGFGWAFRREIVDRHGFYDGLIVGGADVVMAHACYGDRDFFEGRNWYARRLPPAVVAHAADWSPGFMDAVGGRVGYTPGTVAHLWHGDLAARQYTERLAILRDEAFDPRTDLARTVDGCWRWGSDKPLLHRRLREYFVGRREDG